MLARLEADHKEFYEASFTIMRERQQKIAIGKSQANHYSEIIPQRGISPQSENLKRTGRRLEND